MRLSRVRRAFILAGMIWTAWGAAAAANAPISNQDCLECHTDIEEADFHGSAHGSNLCISCHNDIKELPHADTLAPVDCASCHRIETEIYLSSDHGKAVKHGEAAASCTSCHGGSHAILSSRDPRSPVHRTNLHKTCAVCHEDQNKMAKYDLLEKMPVKSYAETIHGKALIDRGVMNAATCTDCHGSHDLHRPTNPLSKTHRSRVPETCGKCHENVRLSYDRSVHGKAARAGKIEAPVCTDCHGEHTIRGHLDPASKTYATSVSEKVCSQCHEAERIISKYHLPSDRLKTYMDSYHGLASKYGVSTVANCASCHGSHDILPASDPSSSVHKKNLPQTCGKCHPNVGEQLAKGSVHVAPSVNRDRAVYWVTLFYVFLIVLVIGGMVAHNLLDFLKKLRMHLERRRAETKPLRFTKGERAQHGVLLTAFLLLAYTGFALKYREAWWALPFTVFGEGDWRGVVHRAAAVVFTALGVFHVGYLFGSRRGRDQFRAMAPLPKDFADLAGVLRYNLGFSKTRPAHARYTYVEKAEYWALLWGSVVMILTGFMLWFENFVLRHFPKWAIDVAGTVHFYEAVLATLAILVWHFYFVIFDPDQYPLNTSMWTGKGEGGEEPPPKKLPKTPRV